MAFPAAVLVIYLALMGASMHCSRHRLFGRAPTIPARPFRGLLGRFRPTELGLVFAQGRRGVSRPCGRLGHLISFTRHKTIKPNPVSNSDNASGAWSAQEHKLGIT
jgi:hypothetical protein